MNAGVFMAGVLSSLAGFFLASVCVAGRPVLRGFLGVALGFGLTSLVLFLLLCAGGAGARTLLAVETGMALILGCLYVARRRGSPLPAAAAWTKEDVVLFSLFALVALLGVYSFWGTVLERPHGVWDAYWNWNMKARFAFRGGDDWRDFLQVQTRALYVGVGKEYPWLLPASVARLWFWAGGEDRLIPGLVAFGFSLTSVGLLYAGIAALASRRTACLAAALLAGTPDFVRQGTYLIADIPLGAFSLATVILLCLADGEASHRGRIVVLAGFAAGLACWTKNEGLVFFAAVVTGLAAVRGTGQKRAAAPEWALFLLGSLPALAVLVFLKGHVAWMPLVLEGSGGEGFWSKILNLSYHRYAMATFLSLMGPGLILALYLALAGFRPGILRRRGVRAGWSAVLLTLAGYYVAPFVMSWAQPFEFTLIHSVDRLLMQLWPSVLFLCFLTAADPRPWRLRAETPPPAPAANLNSGSDPAKSGSA